MDVVFLGDSEPPKPSNPNATPKPWTGVDVLLALEKNKKELILKYFAPEERLEYGALPKNEQNKFDLPSTLSTPEQLRTIGAIRQVRVRVVADRSGPQAQAYSVHAYLLSSMGGKPQVYRVANDGRSPAPTLFGPPFDKPVRGIYVNNAAVWAICENVAEHNRVYSDIWFRAHNAADADPWTCLHQFTDWEVLDIHPGDDGLLIACVKYTYFGYTPEDGWKDTKVDIGDNHWEAYKMARLPLDGFRMFNAAWESAQAWKLLATMTWLEKWISN
jgi:hypothetical protein